MEIGFDISFTDFPVFGPDLGIRDVQAWREQTWGPRGIELAMDTAVAAGVRTVNFRVHAPGPMWPSNVPGTTPHNWAIYSRKLGLEPDMGQWNMVKDGIDIAHRKGLRVLGWFDMTEGHAGLPTAWSLNHPQFCIVSRDGIRMDGPLGLVGKDGTTFDKTMVHVDHEELIARSFMDVYCTRPDGVSIDPQLSFAYPQVVDYRLALIDEALDYGLDGLFLVACLGLGYEPPVRDSFKQTHSLDPLDLPEDDPRWIKHQQSFFTAFVRRVNDLVRQKERATGRKIELIIEGQGGIARPGYREPEIGWENLPNWGAMPAYIEIETLARERLVDALAFWSFRDVDALPAAVRDNIRIVSRFRYMSAEQFTEENYHARVREAEKCGVSLLLINEARGALARSAWMYPGPPGPLFRLTQELISREQGGNRS